MKQLYELSLALLWGLVVLEAVVLEEILRRTVSFRQIYVNSHRRSRHQQLSTGTPAPEFSAPVLGTISTSNLRGRSTILLFVSPAEGSSPLYRKLSVAIHALWHRADSSLYLVCIGGEDACRQIVRDHHVDGFRHGQVPVLLDEEGSIARTFFIGSTPQAVFLDQDVRVGRYGHPLPTEDLADAGT